jgi:Spy/CpxP family protein refolding chaperone
MKKFVKVLTIGGLALSLAGGVFAQGAGPAGGAPKPGLGQGKGQGAPGQGPRGGAGMMRRGQDEMFAKLNLTADQKKKVEALNKALQDKVQGMFQKNKNGDRSAMREQMKPIMEKYQKDLKAILTKAQWDQLEKMRQERREKMRQQFGAGAGKPGEKPGTAPKPPATAPKPPAKGGKGGGA